MSTDRTQTKRILHAPDSPMTSLLEQIGRIASSRANVLVIGESGVGKEAIVRTLHDMAPWRSGPFVPINCGAIPENLLESELFGYARGAFTGADRPRAGRFDAANGGTLFLDEIGDMPMSLQVKLLRVLQEQEYQPLGSNERRKATFRVVTATNKNLEESVVENNFRQDLFFRLDVVRLPIPSLRERPMDIPVLADHFLEMYRRPGSGVPGFTAEALTHLRQHDWPGNVRELENMIHSILVLKEGDAINGEDVSYKLHGRMLTVPDAPTSGPRMDLPEEGLDLKQTLEQLERHLIRQALSRASGNKAAAANLLSIKRTTLVEKLKRNPVADGATPPAQLASSTD